MIELETRSRRFHKVFLEPVREVTREMMRSQSTSVATLADWARLDRALMYPTYASVFLTIQKLIDEERASSY